MTSTSAKTLVSVFPQFHTLSYVDRRCIDHSDRSWSIYHLDMHCPSATSLEISFRLLLVSTICLLPKDVPGGRSLVSFLTHIVSSAPKTTTTVTFVVDLHVAYSEAQAASYRWTTPRGMEDIWTAFEEALGPRRLPNVRKVRFMKYGLVRDGAGHEQMVQQRLSPYVQYIFTVGLPILTRRGILSFE